MEKDEKKVVTLKIPKNFILPHLVDQDVEFLVEVVEILTPRKITDIRELAKLNSFESLDEYRKFIKDQTLRECEGKNRLMIVKQLVDQLSEDKYDFDIPESMIEHEISKMKGLAGSDLQNEIKMNEGHENTLAKKRVKIGMLFMNFAQNNKISINNQDIIRFLLSNYSQSGMSSLEEAAKVFSQQ